MTQKANPIGRARLAGVSRATVSYVLNGLAPELLISEETPRGPGRGRELGYAGCPRFSPALRPYQDHRPDFRISATPFLANLRRVEQEPGAGITCSSSADPSPEYGEDVSGVVTPAHRRADS